MKIFLTGSTGFIGSHVLKQALQREVPIVALRRSITSVPRIAIDGEPVWVTKDLSEVTPDDVGDCDTVVHLAAHSANVPYDTLENCIRANVLAPIAAFRSAAAAGVKRFIIAGTCFEYGAAADRYDEIPVDAPLEPTTNYPASKAAATVAFHSLALELQVAMLSLRIFQVYGPGESPRRFWPGLIKAAAEGRDFDMSEGLQVRAFIRVEDVANGFLEAACIRNLQPGLRVENLPGGIPLSLGEFARREWAAVSAPGRLNIGAVPMRPHEQMKIVPRLTVTSPPL